MKDEQIKSANVLCIDNGSFNCLNDKTNEENYEELLDHQVDNFVRVFKFVTEEKNQGTFVKAIIEGLKREEMIYSLSEQEMCTAIKEGLNKGIEEFTKKGETIVTLLQDRLELKKIKGSEGILFYQKVLIMIGSCFKICKERNI